MKTSTLLLAILSALAAVSSSQAQTFAGDDSARYYKSNPEQFDGKNVDVDCVFVTRINGGPQVEGVKFFVAHTKDDENNTRGGAIVVAVLDDKANSFVRTYGNTVDIQRGADEKVSSKRLRGVFHQLEHGHVYIDTSSGEAHELIIAHKETALDAIRTGNKNGIPRAANKSF